MPQNLPTTSWSLILESSATSSEGTRHALALFCESYWVPVYAYLRSKGLDVDQAQDLTQGFFLNLIEKGQLRQADPARGRFRSFLLTCVHNYWLNELDRKQAGKRGGTTPPISLDMSRAEEYFRATPGSLTPEQIFDRRWALSLIELAMARLREEYSGERKDLFTVLSPNLLDLDGAVSYRVAAENLGMSEGAVKVAAHRMRRRFGEVLRHEIGLTLNNPAEVDEELAFLISCLATTPL